MKFLVPIDFSEVTDNVLDETITLATALDGEVELMNVLQLVPEAILYENSMPIIPFEDSRDHIEKEHLKQLNEAKTRLENQEIPCSIVIREGSPAREILSYIEDNHFDYVVIGSHGHGALYHLVLGSVSEKVMDKATCPVIVVKHL